MTKSTQNTCVQYFVCPKSAKCTEAVGTVAFLHNANGKEEIQRKNGQERIGEWKSDEGPFHSKCTFKNRFQTINQSLQAGFSI